MGVALMLRHPKVASVSCKRCTKVWLDEDWEPVMRGGVEQARPSGMPPPCNKCPKVPPAIRNNPNREATPSDAVCMTEDSFKAFMYYMEVKAGAKMHDDPYTRMVCALIRNVEDQVEREQNERMDTLPIALALMRNQNVR